MYTIPSEQKLSFLFLALLQCKYHGGYTGQQRKTFVQTARKKSIHLFQICTPLVLRRNNDGHSRSTHRWFSLEIITSRGLSQDSVPRNADEQSRQTPSGGRNEQSDLRTSAMYLVDSDRQRINLFYGMPRVFALQNPWLNHKHTTNRKRHQSNDIRISQTSILL